MEGYLKTSLLYHDDSICDAPCVAFESCFQIFCTAALVHVYRGKLVSHSSPDASLTPGSSQSHMALLCSCHNWQQFSGYHAAVEPVVADGNSTNYSIMGLTKLSNCLVGDNDVNRSESKLVENLTSDLANQR